jgi:hypothetical protein
MDSCLRFMSLCLSFSAWELIARSESSKSKPSENSSNKQPNKYLAAWEKQVQLISNFKKRQEGCKRNHVSSALLLVSLLPPNNKLRCSPSSSWNFWKQPNLRCLSFFPIMKICWNNPIQSPIQALENNKKNQQAFSNTQLFLKLIFPRQEFFSVSPPPPLPFSLSKDPSIRLSVFQGVYQQEKWQQPWQARTSRRKKKKEEEKKSKWEMVQRQTE